MKSIVERLAQCNQVIEWANPNDARLAIATDEPAPNSGGDVRTEWEVDPREEEIVAAEVKRLLVPNAKVLKGLAHAVFARDAWPHEDEPGVGNVVITLTDEQDWHEVFPTEQSRIFKRRGIQAWAAVALCSDEIGLAVFSKQIDGGGVEARVQQVPDDVLQRILHA